MNPEGADSDSGEIENREDHVEDRDLEADLGADLGVPESARELGVYGKLSVAREYGLVLAAQGIPYWIRKRTGGFGLEVGDSDRSRAQEEIERYLAEQEPSSRGADKTVGLERFGRAGIFDFVCAAWILGGCWLLQQKVGGAGLEQGGADSGAILNGEWWRTATALSLHADGGHFLANWIFGTLFGGFVGRRLGLGLAWACILAAGMLANGLNALFHANRAQVSIGASTAVFAALGVLVGVEVFDRRIGTLNRWRWLVPFGAGLGLLAHLGTGGGAGKTDLLGHLLGFFVGLGMGWVIGWLLKTRVGRAVFGNRIQILLGLAAMAGFGVCWVLALLSPRI